MSYLDELGTPQSYNHYPTGWAWAFNTPFKLWKRYANCEGGTADPMIVSWPKGMKARGEIRHQYTHAIDIVPTLYECLGSSPPTRSGATPSPLEGVSFAAPSTMPTRRREADPVLLDGRDARHLVRGLAGSSVSPARPRVGRLCDPGRWELFDTEPTRSECTISPPSTPRSSEELIAPLVDAGGPVQRASAGGSRCREILAQSAPQIAKPRDRYIYYPGGAGAGVRGAEHPEPFVHDRGRADDRDAPPGRAVRARRQIGGHALYLKDGRLNYVYNLLGLQEQIVESTEPITAGHHVLSATFEREGDAMPAEGTLTLHIGTDQGRRGPHQDPAGQVLHRRRRPQHRQGQRGTDHRRLPRHVPVAARRRNHRTRRHRRQRRAVRRSRPRSRDGLRTRRTATL